MNRLYAGLGVALPKTQPPAHPERIVIIRTCCMGDVVMATATLVALRRAYPDAHITWAVGDWSQAVIDGHPMVDELLSVGPGPHPLGAGQFWGFVRQLRAGHYDLAVSLSRSPRMSAAVLLAGIPYRAGLDSAGRGFGYNLRAPIDPSVQRHEVDIYLDVARTLDIDINDCMPTIPISDNVIDQVDGLMGALPISKPFIVINPSGGNNPGATMDTKRYPPQYLAQLLQRTLPEIDVRSVIIVAGPGDDILAQALYAELTDFDTHSFVGTLTLPQIGGLARMAVGYIGNDTGLTHYAAAAGARTAMVLGPTTPARYRPYARHALVLWQPHDLPDAGAVAGTPAGWTWETHGIQPKDAAPLLIDFLQGTRSESDEKSP
jgi:ADP-heptose:LPS heptosyltransferase